MNQSIQLSRPTGARLLVPLSVKNSRWILCSANQKDRCESHTSELEIRFRQFACGRALIKLQAESQTRLKWYRSLNWRKTDDFSRIINHCDFTVFVTHRHTLSSIIKSTAIIFLFVKIWLHLDNSSYYCLTVSSQNFPLLPSVVFLYELFSLTKNPILSAPCLMVVPQNTSEKVKTLLLTCYY